MFYICIMRTIIIMLVLALGVVSCEKNEDLHVNYIEDFGNYEVVDGLLIKDMYVYSNSLYSNYIITDNVCELMIRNDNYEYKLILTSKSESIQEVYCTKNNEMINIKTWRLEVFNLINN